MKLKRLLSTILSVSILGGISFVYADSSEPKQQARDLNPQPTLPSETPTESPIEIGLKREKDKFESRCPGKFIVTKKTIERVDHFLLARTLSCINEVFDRYENITASFVNCLKAQSEDEGTFFRIAVMDKSAFAQFLYHGVNEQEIKLNLKDYSFHDGIPATFHHRFIISKHIESGFSSPVDTSRIYEAILLHEMGHWIAYNCGYTLRSSVGEIEEKSKALGLKCTDSLRRIMERGYVIDMQESQELKERAIRIEVLEIAREIYDCYETFISTYGEKNDAEWIAEVCKHAWGSREPNGLGKAMLYWLAERNKQFGHNK
ncbi:MAG: hypothetical protein Q4D57_01640 [Clostridia bacterium]|nr:hypothetical protein [Clostridia bacterium]